MSNDTTASVLEKKIKKIIRDKINELSKDELISIDEDGARMYLLTGSGGKPYLHISLGNPNDGAMHEWADNHDYPMSCDRGWECWQEEKTPPETIRELMHQNLPNT